MSTHNIYASNHIISHNNNQQNALNLKAHIDRIKKIKNPALPIEKELELLQQLSEFELGRFLLINKGLNGYWTSYIINQAPYNKNLTELEEWIVNSAPVVRATQERFSIFQKILQKNLKNNINIASIPCGLMNDLYDLDYSNISNITLTGIDLDDQSINLARKNSPSQKNIRTHLHIKDAWILNTHNTYDIITSNGLNIYQPDNEKVIQLYKSFLKSLKPGGLLITSFLTPPKAISKDSPWQNFNQDDLTKQKALFSDVIEVSWQTFRTEHQTKEQLQEAGFKNINFFYDTQRMFPTVTAEKP